MDNIQKVIYEISAFIIHRVSRKLTFLMTFDRKEVIERKDQNCIGFCHQKEVIE